MNTDLFYECLLLSKEKKISPSVLIRKFKVDWDLAVEIIEKIKERENER